MTRLSEKLANASVEDAPKLLSELYSKATDAEGIPTIDCRLAKHRPFYRLLEIGPEGWLSAAMMLLPEGWAVEVIIAASREYYKAYLSRYGNDKIYRKRTRSNTHPALALASAIAKTMENDDE